VNHYSVDGQALPWPRAVRQAENLTISFSKGDQVTCKGAKQRAQLSYLKYREEFGSFPHLAVGFEGGLERINLSTETENSETDTLFCMAWIAVYGRRQALTVDMFASDDTTSYYGDKKPIFGLAKTANFPLPQGITKLILEDGMELGDADDKFFSRTNSKQGSGSVGILTDGLINRADYYVHAAILALTPWIRPELYQS